jgi:hypothetical protein
VMEPCLCPVNHYTARDSNLFFPSFFFVYFNVCPPSYLRICLFLSRCTRTFGILWFNVFHRCKVVIMTETRC